MGAKVRPNKKITVALRTIAGPVGTSHSLETRMPAKTDNIPQQDDIKIICKGVFETVRAAAAGMIIKAVINNTPITLRDTATIKAISNI